MRIRPMHSRGPLRFLGSVIIACAAAMSAAQSPAQVPVRATPATPAGRGERAPDYPVRPPAPPEQVARGQQLFKSNCSFCHGSDARGGATGPNLVRAQVVLADQHGELVTPIVQNGIPARAMPKFTLSAAEIADIAAWLHSQPLSDRKSTRLNSSHSQISYAVFCLKKKTTSTSTTTSGSTRTRHLRTSSGSTTTSLANASSATVCRGNPTDGTVSNAGTATCTIPAR